MNIENCPHCGGTHFGSNKCPFSLEGAIEDANRRETAKSNPVSAGSDDEAFELTIAKAGIYSLEQTRWRFIWDAAIAFVLRRQSAPTVEEWRDLGPDEPLKAGDRYKLEGENIWWTIGNTSKVMKRPSFTHSWQRRVSAPQKEAK